MTGEKKLLIFIILILIASNIRSIGVEKTLTKKLDALDYKISPLFAIQSIQDDLADIKSDVADVKNETDNVQAILDVTSEIAEKLGI